MASVTFKAREDVWRELERLARQNGDVHPSKVARRILEEACSQKRLERLLRASNFRYKEKLNKEKANGKANVSIGGGGIGGDNGEPPANTGPADGPVQA